MLVLYMRTGLASTMGGGWGVDPHNDLHNEPHMIMIGAQARFQLHQPMTVYIFPLPRLVSPGLRD